MDTRWKPNVTVAAIIEQEIDGRPHFLLVEEEFSLSHGFVHIVTHLLEFGNV